MGDNLSPADIKAVVGNSNGAYPYPVYPTGANGFGNSGFGDGSWVWLILILALFGGNWGNGGFGGGFGGGNEYAWLSNGQKEIMQNTNDGFNTLQLANQLTGINSGVQNLSTQLCNGVADINSNICNGFANTNQTISSGFANAETSANARQMANMQQNYANQISNLQSFNQLSSQFADCCCENRLASCQTQNIIQNEGNATRFADANNTRDLLTNQTASTQAILDKLCQLELDAKQDKIDAKNEKIADLQRELSMADLRASQTAQNAFISNSLNNEIDLMYNRLVNCPIPSTPVYGRTPIFTCNGNNGCGCGCNNYNGTL